MYEYIPSRQNKIAKIVATAVFIVSLALFALSGWRDLPFRGLFQGMSIILLTAAIMICVKYLLKTYAYRVETGDDGTDFVVNELSRTGAVTVCRLALDTLAAADEWTQDYKPPKKAKIYNYCVDIAPKSSVLLTFRDENYDARNDNILVRVEPDDELRAIFARAVGEYAKKQEGNP